MRDRHNLEALLIRRFPQASREQIASAANAVMALVDQWEREDEQAPCPRCAEPAVCAMATPSGRR